MDIEMVGTNGNGAVANAGWQHMPLFPNGCVSLCEVPAVRFGWVAISRVQGYFELRGLMCRRVKPTQFLMPHFGLC